MITACANDEKYLNLHYLKHVIFTYDKCSETKQDPSSLKLDDAFPETIRTKPTARANLICFTRDKVSKHNVCPRGTWETWRRLRRLNKETAACCLTAYCVGGYRRVG